ncbi:MAG: hypothetical protein A2Y45_02580 [Tenericutes bacterium GWC2_34_14]|nr:MAG: hypothetical protein A2Z84_03640 [Tenericutes bacterium GWA2_35_7]OHE28122.1 MAG: hypothetical protein A2Y45_02580 [Tenericutes bacterium GWC2_34_14]OHE32938.1 MAG: hypothetical protein A2012_09650 [Tenericutes bacterium GWE2_34_108]OHE36097.1 MAG: hypothetical protein A2Y46_06760 [Tenericutes bacterium GWF1_35_14]OHE39320.1 MAG: hypothetical protein A2Y44_06120 [Tenericutes bacterium GWF2_35_184]OHE43803.1 MAG: hypothetical protein A3K26_08930 [Tenericutes bacterium RIFOXYA12_FULL_35_
MRLKRIIICAIFLLTSTILSGCVNENNASLLIEYNTNGGSSIASMIVNEIDEISLPNDPVKEGYIFSGWYLDNNTFNLLFSIKNLNDVQLEKKIILYAKWIEEDAIVIDPMNIPYTLIDFYDPLKTYTGLGYIVRRDYLGYTFKNRDELVYTLQPAIDSIIDLEVKNAYEENLVQFDDEFFSTYVLVLIVFVMCSSERDVQISLPLYKVGNAVFAVVDIYSNRELGYDSDLKSVSIALKVDKRYLNDINCVKIEINNTADPDYPYTAYYQD